MIHSDMHYNMHYNIMFSDSESSLCYLIMKSPSGIRDYTSRNSQTVETGSQCMTDSGVDESAGYWFFKRSSFSWMFRSWHWTWQPIPTLLLRWNYHCITIIVKEWNIGTSLPIRIATNTFSKSNAVLVYYFISTCSHGHSNIQIQSVQTPLSTVPVQ